MGNVDILCSLKTRRPTLNYIVLRLRGRLSTWSLRLRARQTSGFGTAIGMQESMKCSRRRRLREMLARSSGPICPCLCIRLYRHMGVSSESHETRQQGYGDEEESEQRTKSNAC